jgi:hypothetical protein
VEVRAIFREIALKELSLFKANNNRPRANNNLSMWTKQSGKHSQGQVVIRVGLVFRMIGPRAGYSI